MIDSDTVPMHHHQNKDSQALSSSSALELSFFSGAVASLASALNGELNVASATFGPVIFVKSTTARLGYMSPLMAWLLL